MFTPVPPPAAVLSPARSRLTVCVPWVRTPVDQTACLGIMVGLYRSTATAGPPSRLSQALPWSAAFVAIRSRRVPSNQISARAFESA